MELMIKQLIEDRCKGEKAKIVQKKKDIASKLWKDSSEGSQQVKMTNLINGTRASVTPEMVEVLCNELSCTPNRLFNHK